jgi:hypothetical protein
MAFGTQSHKIPHLPAVYRNPDAVVSPSPAHASPMHVMNLGLIYQAFPRRAQEFSAALAASAIKQKDIHLPFPPCRAAEHFSTITIDDPQALLSPFNLWRRGILVNRFAGAKATNPSTL